MQVMGLTLCVILQTPQLLTHNLRCGLLLQDVSKLVQHWMASLRPWFMQRTAARMMEHVCRIGVAVAAKFLPLVLQEWARRQQQQQATVVRQRSHTACSSGADDGALLSTACLTQQEAAGRALSCSLSPFRSSEISDMRQLLLADEAGADEACSRQQQGSPAQRLPLPPAAS